MDLMAANYLHLPGVTTNFVYVPNVANLDGTGTLEFIAKVNLDDWTPDANQIWISKWTGSAGYLFFLESTSNDLYLIWNEGTISRVAIATATPTVTDGDWLWVRVVATEDGDDRDVFFYTSTDMTNDPDDVTWTQLGAEVVVPFGAGDLTTNTAVVFVGAQSATVATMAGSIAAARINFNGVTELDIDFTDLTAAEVDAGSFIEDSGNAATVTIVGTAWAYVRPRTLEIYPKLGCEGNVPATGFAVGAADRNSVQARLRAIVESIAGASIDEWHIHTDVGKVSGLNARMPKIVVWITVPDTTTHADIVQAFEIGGYWGATKQDLRDLLPGGVTVNRWRGKLMTSLGRTEIDDPGP